jgi:beta-lactamase class C
MRSAAYWHGRADRSEGLGEAASSDRKCARLKEAYWRVPAAAGNRQQYRRFRRWMQAMMGERPNVLSAAVLKLAHSPRVKTGRLYGGDLAGELSMLAYGLGWRSFIYGGHGLTGHSGRGCRLPRDDDF